MKGQEEFEEEVLEELEEGQEPEELQRIEKRIPVAKPVVQRGRPPMRQHREESRPKPEPVKERYVVYYQPEVLAIVDNETNEQIATNFNSQGEAMALCKVLNQGEEIRKNTYIN